MLRFTGHFSLSSLAQLRESSFHVLAMPFLTFFLRQALDDAFEVIFVASLLAKPTEILEGFHPSGVIVLRVFENGFVSNHGFLVLAFHGEFPSLSQHLKSTQFVLDLLVHFPSGIGITKLLHDSVF